MDISDSLGLQKNEHLARLYLKHAHYVSASRVTTLEGLQIINWNPHLISMNSDVKEHIEFMKKERKLKLCYTPVYDMPTGLKCVFLNTLSLHKNIENVRANHNICAGDVLIFAETRLLHSDNSENYTLTGFQVPMKNNQVLHNSSRPPHGTIGYVRENIRMLEVKKFTAPYFEAILMCVQHTSLPIPVQVIGYVCPQCKYNEFLKYFHDFMRDSDHTSTLIVMGDFNMKSITRLHEGYNKYVKRDMKAKYILSQIVGNYTTDYKSTLDLCFTYTKLTQSIIWNYWSDHQILAVAMDIQC